MVEQLVSRLTAVMMHLRRLGNLAYLKVPVNNVLLMAILDCRDNLRREEEGR